MSRTPLPHRRQSVTRRHYWRGSEYLIGVGFDPVTGAPQEAFVGKTRGHDIEATLIEACVAISVALQSGTAIRDIAKSLDHVTEWVNGEQLTRRATVLGLVADAVLEEQIIWEAVEGRPQRDKGPALGMGSADVAMPSGGPVSGVGA